MTMSTAARRAAGWITVSVLAGLAGTAGLILGAKELGEVMYNNAPASWGALVVPLLFGALLETASVATGGIAGVEISQVLRRNALEYSLQIDPDRAESIGSGTALSRALDADLVGSFLVTTAPAAILGSIELTVGGIITAGAPDGTLRLTVLAVGCAALGLTWRWLRAARQRWTDAREDITADLVDRLLGQRTVALQEDAASYQTSFRDLMRCYRGRGRLLDTSTVAVSFVVLGTGAALLILALHLPPETGVSESAIAIGAALLAGGGLLRWGRVVDEVAGVQVARRQIAKLAALQAHPLPPAAAPTDGALITARRVVGEYMSGHPVVGPLDFSVRPGEQILLTGPSGSGKTTLVEILDGRREASSGVVERSADCVIARVPQAGDDHLLHASLLFNVVMGACWPPEDEQLADTLEVLHDLGLGPLIDRMPAGILQPIGDGGWRLSAGESSRVRLARALVRRPELLILDETFAPLDAVTFDLSLRAAQKWAGSLLVIAHP